jgi:purine-binding chemotaxis protein CheW
MKSGPDSPLAPSLQARLRDFRYRPEEDVSGLLLPEAGQPPVAAAPATESTREYLSFELQETTYAVPLSAVLEILRARPLVEIPRAQGALLGVVDLRGSVTPVYDLAFGLLLRRQLRKVAGPEEECERVPREARILVARTAKGPAGLWVDRVRDVVRLLPSTVEAVAGEGPVVGRALVAQKPLVLLELERVPL